MFMDRFNHLHRLFTFSWNKTRAQSIPRIIEKKFRSFKIFRAQVTSASVLMLSLFLGYWAHTLSEKDAVKKWENAHHPTAAFVEKTLPGLGFSTLEDEKKLERIYRNLPLQFEEDRQLWV